MDLSRTYARFSLTFAFSFTPSVVVVNNSVLVPSTTIYAVPLILSVANSSFNCLKLTSQNEMRTFQQARPNSVFLCCTALNLRTTVDRTRISQSSSLTKY